MNVGFRHFARVPPTDLHIPILGHLAFGAASARRCSRRVGGSRPQRVVGGPLWQETLEHPLPDPDHASVFADLDPKLHRLPLGIPAGVLGNDGWEWTPLALSCSKVQSDKNTRRREGQVGMTAGTALNHSADEVIE